MHTNSMEEIGAYRRFMRKMTRPPTAKVDNRPPKNAPAIVDVAENNT